MIPLFLELRRASMNITLIDGRAGKSTVGRVLAKRLDYTFIDVIA